MTQQNNQPDPFDQAMDPPQPANLTYGQILFDLYFCALIKGQGKVVFDSQSHSPRQRRTAVKVDIVPLPETGQQWDISREFIAEIRTDGWLQVTLPSLRDVGITDLKALHEKYVKAQLVTYGTYTNSQGQERDLTAPKILAVYENRAACLEAWETDEPEAASSPADTIPGFEDEDEIESAVNSNANGDTGGNEKQRKTALAFLPAIVRSCRSQDHKSIDTEALQQKLAETPLLKDHFTMESPEVLAEVEKALQESPF